MKKLTLIAIILTLLLGLALWQQQLFVAKAAFVSATITVTNTNDSGPGSLRQAIADAASGDTITFDAAGVFATPQTITLTSGELNVNKNLTIQGLGANQLTVSGNNASRVFLISSSTVTLDGLTVTGGNGASTFSSGQGGGIYSLVSTLTVINSTVSGNSANQLGGGIITTLGTVTVTNSTISGNSTISSAGGGIYNGGTVRVTNSTVSGNTAGSFGGGIHTVGGATLTLTNSTITGNRAMSLGGGGIVAGGTETLNNTIVAGNFVGSGTIPDDINFGTIDTANNNLIGNAATSGGITNGVNGNKVGNSGAGTIDINTVLDTTLANNGGLTKTHALVPGSPALNAGSNALAAGLTTDQRGSGFPRIANTTVDIGAFEGAERIVTKTADTNDGACNADCSLREAIAAASPGDSVRFSPLFNTPQVITLALGELTINKDLKILGKGASLLTFSGNNASRVFSISSSTVLIDGLTVSGGNSGSQGGGGIYNDGGTLTLTNSTVSGNSATGAGGIFNNGTLTLTNSIVSGNSAGSFGKGGGILSNDLTTLTNSTISGNSAYLGGGIFNLSTMTLTNCTVTGNSAIEGGGISNFNPLSGKTLTITNSTISGNSASGDGGGISNSGGHFLTLTNSTVTGNRADSDGNNSGTGGGLSAVDNGVTLNNTIVAGNFCGTGTTPDDINGGTIGTANNNLIGDAATSGGIANGVNGNKVGNSGAGTININTVLDTTLASNGGPTKTHALVPGSPALNAGSNALALDASGSPLTTDQRGSGFPRIIGGTVNIGAYEGAFNAPPTITGATISRQAGSPASSSQIATVNDAEDAENTLTVTATPLSGSGVTINGISVDSSGNVTANVEAACNATNSTFTLRVTDSGSRFAEATLTITVIANTPPTLTYPANPGAIYGTGLTINPLTGPTDNVSINSVSLLSVVPSVSGITVDSAGIVTVASTVPANTYSVTVRATDNCGTNTDASFSLGIAKATPVITWNNPADITYGTALSNTQLNATANVAGSFTYTPPLNTVLNAGNGQTLSVTFTPTDTTNYTTASKNVLINVLKATPVVTWNNPADITYGTALSATQLNATANVAGTFNYMPASGTLLNAGNAQTLSVSFTPTDTANYSTATKNVSINVLKATPTITWNNPADITYGTALGATQLNATANVAGSFTYTPPLNTVLNAGNGQTLSVNFTPTDTANYNTASKNVLINVLKVTPVITWNNPADITYGTALSNTQLNATASVAGSFSYTPSSGTVLNAGNGQMLSVNFTPTDTANYSTASKNALINVLKAALTITVNNASRNVGEANPLFTGSVTGVTNGDLITASYNTTATAASPPGGYPITATLNDPNNRLGNYQVTNTPGTLTVGCPTITLNPVTLGIGKAGTFYSQTITPNGGTAPYTFEVTGLPVGLTASPTSTDVTLSGIPTQSGSFNITVTATSTYGCMGSRTYTLSLGAPGDVRFSSDFDGDGKADLVIWRPSTATFWIYTSGGSTLTKQWGNATDVPVPGDYDGDGKADVAVWRPSTGTWMISRSSDGGTMNLQWGNSADVPVPGDYDGDGKTDLAIWRPSTGTWWIFKSNGGTMTTQWGSAGDMPVPGDYDGDGKTDLAVWRASTATFWIYSPATNTATSKQWGNSTDAPVPADYDGDGKADIAVRRPSTGIWTIYHSSNGATVTWQWGNSTDVPMPGDYDGDGRVDLTIWRPSTGIWWIFKSSNFSTITIQWGTSGDMPIR